MGASSLQSASRRDDLRRILHAVVGSPEIDARGLDRILRRHPKDGRGFYSKREILEAFRTEPEAFPISERELAERLRTCPTRSLSGILPVTVLTKPFPCPGRCVFCPTDVRMPKSYVASEPGCQRAEANRFDPYLQTWSRLEAYRRMGHPTSKIELIVLGGTWSHYPEDYQRWFVARCLAALNDFGERRDRRADVRRFTADFQALAAARAGPGGTGGPEVDSSYNAAISARLRSHQGGGLRAAWERADGPTLALEQERNERAAARCVGLAVETRPDRIDVAELLRLRRLGVTKVQVGIQSLDDDVLANNRRGHRAAETRRALALLRAAGFKIHAHWMANLLGSSPERDLEDFARLFEDPAIRPDELKVYPCSLVETAELATHWASGAWRPYGQEELVELLADCLVRVPPWCRVTRVIRDIPSPEIVVGNRSTNLREVVEARLARRGARSRDIRAREIRGGSVQAGELELRELRYEAAGGTECFLEFATDGGHIAAFLRLFLPDGPAPIEELVGSALLREVHVYGTAALLGERSAGRPQHAGLGRRLVERARRIARGEGYGDLAVISAIGTRPWYRRLGFRDGALYQHRDP